MVIFKKLFLFTLIVSLTFSSMALFSINTGFTNEKSDIKKQIEFDRNLKEIANRVNELKEKVYRSKAKLKLLEETLLLGKITGSKAIIRFDDRTGGLFKVVGGEYYLNGKLIYRMDVNSPAKETAVVFDGETPPGMNKLDIRLIFTGADGGALKLFSYLKDYKFNLESSYEFPVNYGKTTSVKIESVDLGPFKNTLEERLSVRYKTLTEDNSTIPF